jgi:Tfp pilus assembly protein PilO
MRAGDPQARWLWWAACALLLANGLVFVLMALPARQQRIRQEDQLLDLQRRIRALKREGESSEVLLTALREVEQFGQEFPNRGDLVGLIARLTKLARSLAVDVPAVDYRPSEVKEAGLTKVTLVMAVEGTYGKIRRYLYELEGMRRHLVIERVSLRDPKGTSELQMQLQLAVYLR